MDEIDEKGEIDKAREIDEIDKNRRYDWKN